MTRIFDQEPTPAERGDYWVAVHTWVLDSDLTTKAKITYVALMSYADRAGRAQASLKALARRTGMCGRSVQRGLVELEEAGLLTRQRVTGADGGNRPTCYRIESFPQGGLL